MPKHKPVKILLVEDDNLDAECVLRAFEDHRIANEIVRVENGEEALNALRGFGGQEPLSNPYVILLDLNMPKMNGLEFLEAIRDDPQLCKSIVFVLTTSDDDKDKTSAFNKNVAGYVLKQNAGEDFFKVINLLDKYWRVVEMPYD